MSPGAAPIVAARGEKDAAAVVVAVAAARCSQLRVPIAVVRPRFRLSHGAIGPSTAATASSQLAAEADPVAVVAAVAGDGVETTAAVAGRRGPRVGG